jgi:hypothetical protein
MQPRINAQGSTFNVQIVGAQCSISVVGVDVFHGAFTLEHSALSVDH